MTSTPQVPDDNLITRRKNVLKSIEEIREKKAEIAKALRGLNVSNPDHTEEDKGFIKQLVDSFDHLSTQENQYLDILTTIVGIHQQATQDVANDFEKKIAEDESKLAEKKKQAEENGEKSEENGVKTEENGLEKPSEEFMNSPEMVEIQEALLELKTVAQAASAARDLNEKLTERLQMQKKKKNAMMEVRNKKARELEEAAAEARNSVMERINKMTELKKSNQIQEKELQSLRKQCLQLGIAMQSEDDVTPEARAALNDNSQRVPTNDNMEKPEMNDEEKEKRREEIRENIKKEREQKEQVNGLIREKLAAMDSRKKRIIQIRKQLVEQKEKEKELEKEISGEGIPLVPSPSEAEEAPMAEVEDDGDVEKSLDDILANAKNNLNNLVSMRERLEEIQKKGEGEISEEDRQLLDSLEMTSAENQESPAQE